MIQIAWGTPISIGLWLVSINELSRRSERGTQRVAHQLYMFDTDVYARRYGLVRMLG